MMLTRILVPMRNRCSILLNTTIVIHRLIVYNKYIMSDQESRKHLASSPDLDGMAEFLQTTPEHAELLLLRSATVQERMARLTAQPTVIPPRAITPSESEDRFGMLR